MTQLLEIAGLVKRFGSIAAVDGISFTVGKGEVLGFLGPNGAGKSTTMKMVTGYLVPSAGTAFVCGIDVTQDPLAAQRFLGYLPEGAPAFGEMTPYEFLDFVGEVRGLDGAVRKQAIARAVERTTLGPVLYQPIETLSKGFKRRVGLAQAILHDPPVLVMDEPTDGLDPNQKHAVRVLIQEMAADKAIVISTHILEEVDAVCSRALIIDRGRIVADGTPAMLSAMSQYHNAVTVTVPQALAGPVRDGIAGLPGVARIEQKALAGDEVALTAFAAGNEFIIERISALAVAQGWAIKGLYAEPGRLDEVFRRLTTSDTSTPATASAEAA